MGNIKDEKDVYELNCTVIADYCFVSCAFNLMSLK